MIPLSLRTNACNIIPFLPAFIVTSSCCKQSKDRPDALKPLRSSLLPSVSSLMRRTGTDWGEVLLDSEVCENPKPEPRPCLTVSSKVLMCPL